MALLCKLSEKKRTSVIYQVCNIKKKISPTSTGHAGNLPYANKTNILQKIEYFSRES